MRLLRFGDCRTGNRFMSLQPPLCLKPGRAMRVGIAGLGEQSHTTVAAA